MIKYILFDLDGTLTESAPGIINSLKYALEKLEIKDYDESMLGQFIGPPLAVSFKKFLGFSDEQSLNAIEVYREYFQDRGLFENAVYDGVSDMLAELKAHGLTLGVATSKPEVYAKKIIEHFNLDGYFTDICGIPLDDEKMTKSQVIAMAVKRLGIDDTDTAVMVGDRDYDVKGAAQNGIKCIGVTYGYGSENELIEAGAIAIAATPMEAARTVCGID